MKESRELISPVSYIIIYHGVVAIVEINDLIWIILSNIPKKNKEYCRDEIIFRLGILIIR